MSRRAVLVALCAGSLVLSPLAASAAPAASPSTDLAASPAAVQGGVVQVPADVRAAVGRGPVDVVVGYQANAVDAELSSVQGQPVEVRERALHQASQSLSSLKGRTLKRAGFGLKVRQDYSNLPVQVVRVESPASLDALAATAGVSAVAPVDSFAVPASSTAPMTEPAGVADQTATAQAAATDWGNLIGQPAAAIAGYDGRGARVAVLDTGVVTNTAATTAAFGDCAGGWGRRNCRIDSFTDTGGTGKQSVHPHGTNVAGVVAGTAPAAGLDVYNVFTSDSRAPDPAVLTALNQVKAGSAQRGVRAVNLSLGGEYHSMSQCGSPYAGVFASLRSAGVLPVVAAGNTAYPGGVFTDGLADPACVGGAVSVGAVYSANVGPRTYENREPARRCADGQTSANKVACFSQTSPNLTLLAPGVGVTAAGQTMSGTSQATPVVSGAVAALAAADPSASIDRIVQVMRETGTPVSDARTGRTTPRLNLAAAGPALAPAPAAPRAIGAGLAAGQSIDESTMLVSSNGQHALRVGLIDYSEGLQLTSTFCDPTTLFDLGAGRPENRLVMQGDGNLVLYSGNGATWWSGTGGHPGARALLQNDRNLVVYAADGRPLWWTGVPCTAGSTDDGMGNLRGRTLGADQFAVSADRRFTLVMQGDGNLVHYQGSRAIWSSGTFAKPGAYLAVQPDNNLVVYSKEGRPLWWSGTSTAYTTWPANNTGRLVLQNDGNVVLYSVSDSGQTRSPMWSTATGGR